MHTLKKNVLNCTHLIVFKDSWYLLTLLIHISAFKLLRSFMENKCQSGDKQLVVLRTFRCVRSSHLGQTQGSAAPRVMLTVSGLDTDPRCGRPCKSLTYIMQMMSRITLINLAKGERWKERRRPVEKSETKLERVFHFVLKCCGEGPACACFTSWRDDFTTQPSIPLRLIRLQVFSADKQDSERSEFMPERRLTSLSLTAEEELPVYYLLLREMGRRGGSTLRFRLCLHKCAAFCAEKRGSDVFLRCKHVNLSLASKFRRAITDLPPSIYLNVSPALLDL